MAPTRLAFCLAILSALLLSSPVSADEPVLVYERVHSLVNHDDNRITLKLWSDDTVEMQFPHYSPTAGHYQWQATPEDRSQLISLASDFPSVSQQHIQERMTQVRQTELVEVADADPVRFELRLETREDVAVMIESPEIWASLIPDFDELGAFAETEKQLIDWMQKQTEGRR